MEEKRNPLRLGAVWLVTAALVSTASQAAPLFSDIYVFGDSLSDVGNTEIVAPGGDIPGTDFTYGDNGRFSNGRVWVEYLSEDLGLSPVLEPSRSGGSNYAHGGAAFDERGGPETGIITQYQNYLDDIGVQGSDSDALYIVWGGANDLRDKIRPGADPLAVINQSIGNYRDVLTGLISTGAEHLLVPNVPNLGRTPEARNAGISAEATQLTMLWNSILSGMLQNLSQETDANIYAYDAFGVIESIFANQDQLGFTNVSEPCSHMEGTVQVSCANPDQYIFWDILHPTTAAHELIGEGAHDLLASRVPPVDVPLPATIWLLIPGLTLLLVRRRREAQPMLD